MQAAPPEPQAGASSLPAVNTTAKHKEEVLRQLVRTRVEAELLTAIPDLCGDTPETRSAVHKVASAILVPGSEIKLDQGERVIMARGKGNGHRHLSNWIRSCVNSRAWGWHIEPIASGIDDLPAGPVLRLVILTRMDFGSILQVQRSKRTKSGAIESEDYKRVLAADQAAERAAPMYADVLAETYAAVASNPELGDRGTQIVALLVSRRSFEDSECAAIEQAATKYAQRADADPWLAQYLLGHAAIRRAWCDRGTAYARDTTAEQFEKFQQGLDRAYDHLIEAQRIDSGSPYAAACLAVVARGSNRVEHMTPEYWFERATVIDPTCFEAYHALAWASTPRWGGDLKDVISFYRRVAAASNEFNRLGYAMFGWLAAFHDDDPAILTDQSLARAVVDSLRPMFVSTDASTESLARSAAFAIAFKAKAPDLMRDVLADEGWTYTTPHPEYYKETWPQMLHYVDERHPVYGALLSEARAVAMGADLDLAIAKADQVLKQPDLPPRIRTELGALAAARDAQVQFADGREIVLVSPGSPLLLASRSGQPIPQATDSVSFGFTQNDVPQSERVRFQSSIRVGQRVVISGRMRETLRDEARVGMFYGQLSLGACSSESPTAMGIAGVVNVVRPKVDLKTTPDPLVVEHTFRFVVDGVDSTIEVDGEQKKVMKHLIGPEEGWGDWLVVTGRTGHPDATLELIELRAQRLERR